MGNEDALGKTKVMIVSRTEEKCKLSIEGEDIEDVKKLKYIFRSNDQCRWDV